MARARLLLFAGLVATGCLPVTAPGSGAAHSEAETTSLAALTAQDAAFVLDEINQRRLVLFASDDGRWRPVRGCRVGAAYGFGKGKMLDADVDAALRRRSAEQGGVYRVAALASNELPQDGDCARVTHAASAVEVEVLDPGTQEAASDVRLPAAATLERIGTGQLFPAATLTHLTSRVSGDWVLDTNQNVPFCALPCDAWVLPAYESVLRDRSSSATLYVPEPSAPGPSSFTVTTGKEHKEPVIGWLAFGFGLAATGFGVGGTYAVWSGTASSSTSWSGAFHAGADQAAGMVLLPLLTASAAWLAGWGVWELLRAPKDVPVIKRVARLLRTPSPTTR